jgi:membrane fusion protein (multidrug efflux system)
MHTYSRLRLSRLILLKLGLFPLLLTAQPPGNGGDRRLPVVVSPVVMEKNFGDRVEALGTTSANESVEITASVSDFITVLHFDDGDTVAKGDPLVELNREEEQAALASARALLDERTSAFQRAEELVKQNALSTATLQEREALLRQTQGQIEGLEAQLRDRKIQAPFAGVLGLRQVSPGALVSPGQVITTLDDLSRIKVDFDAPSLFLASLRPGLAIEGRTDAYPDRVFTGEIRTVGSRVDPVTRTVSVRAVLPNPDQMLRPGLLMSIELTKNQRESLLIPEGAVVQRGDTSSVFVIEETAEGPVARQREIVLGTRIPGRVEVVSGLNQGDQVVVHGLMQVRPDQPVKVLGVKEGDEPLESFLTSATE